LLAEDDADVRRLPKTVLKESGYTVITALDGEDPVSKFKENRGQVQLVILDVAMPRKTGKEAYVEIIKIKLKTKALFTSGYIDYSIDNNRPVEGGVDILAKPNTLASGKNTRGT
jgi:DNA-binding response OmpR family regulator